MARRINNSCHSPLASYGIVEYIIWTKSADTGPDQTTVLLASDIAIVGATGFIGRHVCGLLDRSASRVWPCRVIRI